MQAHLLVRLTPINVSHGLLSASSANLLISPPQGSWHLHRDRACKCRHRLVPLAASSSFPISDAINGEQNLYSVLGVEKNATSADIKRAYRLLARKYHPDVSKDSRAGDNFKNIRHAYEVLSDNVTRIQYDSDLTFEEDTRKSYKEKWNNSPESEDRVRFSRWAYLRRKMHEQYKEQDNVNEKNSFVYDETDDEAEEGNLDQEIQYRGSFAQVLTSAFISLLLLKTLGSLFSLTFSSLMAFFDEKLDNGYKIGYFIAWIMGGRGGILLTLCLNFATWVCGKASSGVAALVVVAMWIGSNLARYTPIPQGALLALMYMSMKLQLEFK